MTTINLKNSPLSFLGKRWYVEDSIDGSRHANSLTERLLVARGMMDDEMTAFLDPGLHRLHDPFLFPDMEVAVHRLIKAMEDGETIALFGDYDADGQTGTALLKRILSRLGAHVITYIPNRMEEGYGLNVEALQGLKSRGVTVVVTVDCGITNVEEAVWAGEHGISLIITDHHLPPDTLPPAVAIINPRIAPEYPFSELAGCGVAFKLGEALGQRMGKGREIAHEYVDLVAVGTVADVVSLTGENRSLVSAGLAKLNAKNGVPGLLALSHVAGVKDPVKAGHLAFQIGPRLNAAGRISDPSIGVRLLTAETMEDALPDAHLLESENNERRQIEEKMIEQARSNVERTFDPEGDRAIVVAGDDWHPGVIGIVASRIVETYYRPTIVFSIDGDTAKGSGRSIPGFNLYEALEQTSDLLEQFGGHSAAAGVTIQTDRLDLFRQRFLQIAHDRLTDDDLVPGLHIDAPASVDELTMSEVADIARIEPFGIGNPSPVLLCTDVRVDARTFGKDGDHLRLTVRGAEAGVTCEAVAFRLAHQLSDRLKEYSTFDIAFTPEINEWNGMRKVQMVVKDMRPARYQPSVRPSSPTISRDILSVRVVDKRGSGLVDELTSIVDSGRSIYLPVATDEIAFQLRQELAESSPTINGKIVDFEEQSKAQAILDHPPWVVIIPGVVPASSPYHSILHDAMARGDLTCAVCSIPPDPSDLLRHFRFLETFASRLHIVLLYGDDEGEQIKRTAQQLYPDRETLRIIYKSFRQSGGDLEGEVERQAVRSALSAEGIGVTDQTISAALDIFMQVGLVARQKGRYILRENPPKVDLTDAVRYNIGVKLKDSLDDYIEFVLTCPSDHFLPSLSSYIEGRTTSWP